MPNWCGFQNLRLPAAVVGFAPACPRRTARRPAEIRVIARQRPHARRARPACAMLELLHSMKVDRLLSLCGISLQRSDPLSLARFNRGNRSVPVPRGWPGAERLPDAGLCVALAAPQRAWIPLKPLSALASERSGRLPPPPEPGTRFSRKPNKTVGLSDSCAEAEFRCLSPKFGRAVNDSARLRHCLQLVSASKSRAARNIARTFSSGVSQSMFMQHTPTFSRRPAARSRPWVSA